SGSDLGSDSRTCGYSRLAHAAQLTRPASRAAPRPSMKVSTLNGVTSFGEPTRRVDAYATSSTTSVGAWSASSSLTSTTRSDRWGSGITSPAFQFGTAVRNVGGSGGLPSSSSSLEAKAIRFSLPLSAGDRAAGGAYRSPL